MNVGYEVDIDSRKRRRAEEQDAKNLGVNETEILDVRFQEQHEKKLKQDRDDLVVRLEKFRVGFWEKGQRVLKALENLEQDTGTQQNRGTSQKRSSSKK